MKKPMMGKVTAKAEAEGEGRSGAKKAPPFMKKAKPTGDAVKADGEAAVKRGDRPARRAGMGATTKKVG